MASLQKTYVFSAVQNLSRGRQPPPASPASSLRGSTKKRPRTRASSPGLERRAAGGQMALLGVDRAAVPVRHWGATVVRSCASGRGRHHGAGDDDAGRPGDQPAARWPSSGGAPARRELALAVCRGKVAPEETPLATVIQIRRACTPSAAPAQACHGAPRGARPRRAAVRLQGGDDGRGSSMMAPGGTPPRSSKQSVLYKRGAPPSGSAVRSAFAAPSGLVRGPPGG